MAHSDWPRRRNAPRGAGRRSVVFDLPNEIDPSLYFGTADERRPDRKTFQLCRQVARSLALALSGECRDDVLRDVYVDTVEPAPDASRLLVTVRPTVAGVDPDAVLARLQERAAFLRARSAEAICRKRAPTLAFRVAGLEEQP